MHFLKTHSVMQMRAVVFVAALVMVCGGCGAPVSGDTAGSQSPPIGVAQQADKTTAIDGLPTAAAADRKKRADGRANETGAANQFADRTAPSELSAPRSILADLASPEARTRLRALEHWEEKDSKVSLEAVFEALEDEDEAVRTKAESIVEQRWMAEQEKKNN